MTKTAPILSAMLLPSQKTQNSKFETNPNDQISETGSVHLYRGTSIASKDVIPAKAGIQEKTGFRVKPGMTNGIKLISLYTFRILDFIHSRLFRISNFVLRIY